MRWLLRKLREQRAAIVFGVVAGTLALPIGAWFIWYLCALYCMVSWMAHQTKWRRVDANFAAWFAASRHTLAEYAAGHIDGVEAEHRLALLRRSYELHRAAVWGF